MSSLKNKMVSLKNKMMSLKNKIFSLLKKLKFKVEFIGKNDNKGGLVGIVFFYDRDSFTIGVGFGVVVSSITYLKDQ